MIPPEDWDRYRSLFGRPELLARIKSIERYVARLLPFIPRGLPVFQAHGIEHSLSIIRNINQIIHTPGFDEQPHEVFLLYAAAWMHDLGYLHPETLVARKTHSAISARMIRQDPTIQELVNEEEQDPLEDIIQNHDTHADLTLVLENSSRFRTPLLAAMFRLADAVDIGADRCPPEVYSLIQDGLDVRSRMHWLAHQNIQKCTIEKAVVRIKTIDPGDRYFRERIIPHLEEDIRSTEVIFRRYGLNPFILVCE